MRKLILLFSFWVLLPAGLLYSQDCEDPEYEDSCECPLNNCEYILTIQKYYTFDSCEANSIDRRSEIHFEFLGPAVSNQLNLIIEFDDDLITNFSSSDFTLDSGPDGNGIVSYEIGDFSVFNDAAVVQEAKFDLDYDGTGSSDIEWQVVNGDLPSEVLQTGTITFPSFVTVDGSSSAVYLSDLSGSTLPTYEEAQEEEQYLFVRGTFIIDEDYQFSHTINGGSQIVMDAGAKIVVEDGKKLHILGSQFYGCEYMWRWIEVEPGAECKLSRARIEDAHRGLNVLSNFTSSATTLRIHWSEFFNNYYGIYSRYPVPIQYNRKQNIEMQLFGANTFASRGGYMLSAYSGMGDTPNDYPYCGMLVDKWPRLLMIFNTTDHLGVAPNSFKELQYGILADQTDFLITLATFDDIEDYYGEDGVGIRMWGGDLHSDGSPNNSFVEFTNCDRAIKTTHTTMKVIENDFENVGYGIEGEMNKLGDALITGNTIDYRIKGVSMTGGTGLFKEISGNTITCEGGENNPNEIGIEIMDSKLGPNAYNPGWIISDNELMLEDGKYGISLQNAEQVKIFDVTVDILDNSVVSQDIKNIGISLEGSERVVTNCNQVSVYDDSNIDVGLALMNSTINQIGCDQITAHTGIRVLGPCAKSKLKGATTDGSVFDLQYSHPENIYSYTGLQILNGNLFKESSGSEIEAKHYGTSQETSLSYYYVDNTETPPTGWKFLPRFDSNNSKWFQDLFRGGNYSCDEAVTKCGDEPIMPVISLDSIIPTKVDSAIVRDSISVWVTSGSTPWTARRRLYRQLLHSTVIDTLYSSFKEELDGSTEEAFEYLDMSIQSSLSLDSIQNAEIDELDQFKTTTIEELLEEVENYFDTLSNYSDPDFSFLQSIINDILETGSSLDTILYLHQAKVDTLLDTIRTYNQTISTSEVYETNEKEYNDILLKVLIHGTDSLTSGDLDDLLDIADQCPYMGGNAVFKARAFLNFYDEPRTFDLSECDTIQAISVPTHLFTWDKLSVVPNPASNRITVRIPATIDVESAVMVIFRINGKLVRTENVDNVYLKELDVTDLSPGMYLIRVHDTEGKGAQSKFVLTNE